MNREETAEEKILITGASGLLGKALVRTFTEKQFFVFGQYHTATPRPVPNCQWMKGDFSDIGRLRKFLRKHHSPIAGCGYLINNYGPMTSRKIPDLTAEDFIHDYFHNLVTAFEMTRFFIDHAQLESVIFIGFENLGKIMPYRNVLTYAAAKNALLLLNQSFARHYRNIRFNMVSPVSIIGSESVLKAGRTVSPEKVAHRIYDIMTGDQSGRHHIIE